jgi:hypothetical protein
MLLFHYSILFTKITTVNGSFEISFNYKIEAYYEKSLIERVRFFIKRKIPKMFLVGLKECDHDDL